MGYSREINVQLLISLLKQFNIKKIIVSPGGTNITFVHSIQQDNFFTLYSAVDERSAAYMACGLAAENNEPIALSCTGATASRNYFPALTEAYYRKIPVLAITSMQPFYRIGQLYPQAIDRSIQPKDTCVYSAQVPSIHTKEEFRDCYIKINTALNMLTLEGGGPVHINLETTYSSKYDIESLPEFRKIEFYAYDNMPDLKYNRIGIFIGSHKIFSIELENNISTFCEKYNCTVFCDHTSNYYGKNKIIYNLVSEQVNKKSQTLAMDLLIDLGQVSASYLKLFPKEVWRLSEDGKIQDRWGSLTKVFKMKELDFFRFYNKYIPKTKSNNEYFLECNAIYKKVYNSIPSLPFSNAWIASYVSQLIPKDSIVHIGRSNISRCWHYYSIKNKVEGYSNAGTYGIDGVMSTFLGSCLANVNKIHYLFIGDLSFFYDINCLGNKHFPNNARIMLINNGCGTEFKNFHNPAFEFGEEADDYIAAIGHFGNKSETLVKNFANNLGFEYICASDKDQFKDLIINNFIESSSNKSVIFEVFTTPEDENKALELIKKTY